jgi:2-methylisocitrate lyase-like PEP mutase family enzyme
MTPAVSLRTLVASGRIVVAPGAMDSLSARLVERAGFPAVYMTGLGATASRLGMPDIGLLTQTEMTEHARNMARAVSIPIIADADTGYGGPSNIHRTVREHVQAGVAAIHLEDQVAPKRCGQLAGIRLIDAEEAAARLRCAVEARGRDDLLVIGRTDAMPAMGPGEAIRRAKLYQQCGVDLVFVDGIKTIAEVEAVAKNVTGPKVVSIVDGNETVKLTARDLEGMGFQIVLYAVTALFAAINGVETALAHLKASGTPAGGPATATYGDLCDIVDLGRHQELDGKFGRG